MARRAKPAPSSASPLAELEEALGHRFARRELLQVALTHRSLAFESAEPAAPPDPAADNERLEFLGDAVLGLAVAQALFLRFPAASEGDLTRLRASLVSRRSLSEVAARLDLGRFLLLGRGEEQSGGRRKPALLSNALEAVAAAIFLDAGLDAAQGFAETHLVQPALSELEGALAAPQISLADPKSALQEHLQATGAGQPRYVLTGESGPDHQKLFRIEVLDSSGQSLGAAEGSTKKEAQQAAADRALRHLLGVHISEAAPEPR